MWVTNILSYFFRGMLGALLNQNVLVLLVALTVPFLVGLTARALFGIPRHVSVTAVAAGIAIGGAIGVLGISQMGLQDMPLLPLGTAWLSSLVGAFAGGRASTAEEPTE